MDDVLKIVVLIGLGVGTYAGVTVISVLKRRFEPQAGAAASDELDSLQARLAAVETLEARVNELEERVDFAERLVATQHAPDRLSFGQPLDHQ